MPSEFPGVLLGSRGRGSGIKKSKPAMEKRRRARINASLAELRSLIPESVKRGNRRWSKMEKADILELAVLYLRHLQDANQDKGQVSKTSYNLGFSECTQEVSQFFRSTSPATCGLKGSLLEHLNGCAPDTSPDSPSTSAAKSAPTSTNGFFKTSSIIARCLLSSTMVVTPKKISAYGRHSSTPTAVSSTSDGDSSEASVDAAQDMGDNNQLETGTGIPKPDGHEASHVQRLEIFKVKKDLISSFNGEPKEHKNSNSRLANYITSNFNLDQSSRMSVLQDNTELNDTCKEQNMNDDKQEKGTSLSITVNPREATTNAIANVCSLPSSPETNEPIVEAILLDKQAERLLSKSMAPLDLATANVQSLTQTNEKTDAKMGNRSTDTNNNRNSHTSTTEGTEIIQINSSSVTEYSDLDPICPRKLPVNIQEISCTQTISQNTDNCIRNRTIDVQTLAQTLALEQACAESASSDIDETSQNGAAFKLQQESMSVAQIPHVSDNPGCSQENRSKICLPMEDSSDIMPNMSPLLIPAYFQISLQRETPPFQQAIVLKSPNKTNSLVPAMLATSTSTISTINEEKTTDDSCASNRTEIASSDVQLCHNQTLETDCPLYLPPLIPKQIHISLESSGASHLEGQTDSQTDITEDNIISSFKMAGNNESTISSLNMAGNKESILPTVISPCFKDNAPTMTGNNTLKTNNINSVVSHAKTGNAPVLLLNAVNLANFTSHNRKRPLPEADALEKSEGREKSPTQNSDNAKKIRLSPTYLLQPASYQDSRYTNETMRQYMATKFRPIAPKNFDIRNVESEDFSVFQQKGNISLLSLKQQVSGNNNNNNNNSNNNNVFTSMSRSSNILCQKSILKIGKEPIPNHNNCTLSANMGHHQLLSQCGNAKSLKDSAQTSLQADDILTTVLKSTIPLDKTLFEARRLNTSKFTKHESMAESQTSNKQQNEHLRQTPPHDTYTNQNSLCQSYNKNNKSPTPRNAFNDQVFTAQFQKQICEFEKEEGDDGVSRINSLVDDNNVLLDPTGKHPHYNVSAILRELCHRCRLSDGASKSNISEFPKCMSGEHKHNYITGAPPNLSPAASQHDGDSQTKTVQWNSSPIDLTVNQQIRLGHLLHEEELGKGHFSFTESSQENVTSSDQGRTSTENEQIATSNDFQTHTQHAISTNNIPGMLDSALTQPLNLSLRDNNRETKTPRFQDKETADRDYSPGLDLSLSRGKYTSTPTLNVSHSNSSSQTSSPPDNEHHSPTTKPHQPASFRGENQSQWKGVYPTNVTDSNNLLSLFSSVGFSHNEQSQDSKPSADKDSNLNQEINTECRAFMAAGVETWSRPIPMSRSSGKTAKQNEFEHYTENMQYAPRTAVPTGGCSPGVHQNCHVLPERSITTMLPSLQHIDHSPGDTAGTGDDVWRPW